MIVYLVVDFDVIKVSHPKKENSLISSKWWLPLFLLGSSCFGHRAQFKEFDIACIFVFVECPTVECEMFWLLQLEFD